MNKLPNELNYKILNDIKSRLIPDLKIILLKLFAIHLACAIATLSICPQFGFSTFKTNLNLMDVFMKIGPHFCDFACGAFFTTTSMIFVLILLSRDEIRVLRYRPFLLITTMILSSLGFLLMVNPGLFLGFTLLWLVGAIVGVIGSMEMGFRVISKI